MRRSLTVFLVTCLASGTVLAGATGAAQTGGAASEPAWELALETSPERIAFESTRQLTTAVERTGAVYDVADARLDYVSVRQQPTQDGEAELGEVELHVEITAVYEFVDTNDNGAFDLGDQIRSFQYIDDATPVSVARASYPGPAEGATVSYALPAGGSLDVELFMSPRPQWIGTRLLFPQDTELNLTVRDWPARTPEASLAVQVQAWGQGELRQSGPGIQFVKDDITGYARWFTRGNVDGQWVEAGDTVLEHDVGDGDERRHQALVILSGPAGATVRHEFSVGNFFTPVNPIAQAFKGNWPLYTAGLMVAVVLVSVSLMIKLREGPGGRTIRDA